MFSTAPAMKGASGPAKETDACGDLPGPAIAPDRIGRHLRSRDATFGRVHVGCD
jgi:hypothetical protein